jgi:hypothetical protein
VSFYEKLGYAVEVRVSMENVRTEVRGAVPCSKSKDRGYHDPELVLSVCTGALLLAEAGLLDGLEATTHYGAIDLLRQTAPQTTVHADRRFVDNWRVICSGGIAAGIDMSLHVLDRLLGRDVAVLRWRASGELVAELEKLSRCCRVLFAEVLQRCPGVKHSCAASALGPLLESPLVAGSGCFGITTSPWIGLIGGVQR